MKKILFLSTILFYAISFAQINGYNDLGVLLTNQNKQSTARTMAMKNAFGALGGDLSSFAINPAVAAIYNTSSAAMTLNYTNLDFE